VVTNNAKTLVLIPVYNEEAHLAGLLHRLRQVYSGDVLCVDDGSVDRSVEVLGQLKDLRTRVIHQPFNRGYGATLIRGFSEAHVGGYDFLVTMDSDGQHRPDWIPRFFEAVRDWDVVSGSRYLVDSAENAEAPTDRRRINTVVTEVINSFTGFGLTDAFCGFKAYRVAALAKLSLQESGYSMPLQFWIQAKVFGLRVTELPVSRIYDDPNRSFGADLDIPEKRLAYYLETITKEKERWKM
jgi:glycosyltransferase involved in cell wall biosynthesis